MDGTHESNAKRRKLFLTVFVLLAALTGLSFGVANSSLMDRPAAGWTAMMMISAAKAMLVVTFFMHLWWEQAWKYALTIPTLIMGALLVWLLIPDIGFRTEHFTQDRLQKSAVAVPSRNTTITPSTPEQNH